jgi:hypothetical protein
MVSKWFIHEPVGDLLHFIVQIDHFVLAANHVAVGKARLFLYLAWRTRILKDLQRVGKK